jgi:hypothetical protein
MRLARFKFELPHAYFLIRNASLARNSLAFSSSFLAKGIFKKVLVVITITFTHFLRHLTQAWLAGDMVTCQVILVE